MLINPTAADLIVTRLTDEQLMTALPEAQQITDLKNFEAQTEALAVLIREATARGLILADD